MHILKKLIFAAAFLSLMVVGASAEENLIRPIGGVKFTAGKNEIMVEPKENVGLFSTPEQPLEEYLVEQCMNHIEEIDIESYNISMSKDELLEFFYSFSIRHPELLIHSGYDGFHYRGEPYLENGTEIFNLVKIHPMYFFEDKATDDAARDYINEKIDEYVTLAEAYETPLEKLLAVHDKLVETYEYDDLEPGDEPDTFVPSHGDASYHMCGLFINDVAVCQGYSEAFYMIANKLGIETNYCRSDSINHIWNYVKLDGKWYHVDVTWDDPITLDKTVDPPSRVATVMAYHNNFLISDDTRCSNILSGYPNADINDWIAYLDVIPNCGSTTYESEYLFNMSPPFNISQEGGYFVASCQINGKQYDFRSQSLHSGLIAATAPVCHEYNYEIFFLPLANYNGSLTPITVNHKNGKESSYIKNNSLNFEYFNVFIPRDASADYTDIFIWDLKNLRPACDKMRVS